MIFRPYDYQKAAIKWGLEHPRCGLFLDMGLGKSVITLTIIQQLIDDCEIDRALVVAPKKVAETTWTGEAEKWEHLKGLRVVKVTGTEKQRNLALASKADVYVIGRDSFVWLVGKYGGNLPFDVLVIDELTSFKSSKSNRFKAMRMATPTVQRVIGLTGTPAPNGLIDLWAQMEFLSHSILNMNLRRFKNTFCYYTKVEKICGYRHYYKEFVTGHANIDYLYSLIRHYVYECDLHLDIKQNYHTLEYKIGKDEREAYNEVKREFLSDEMLEFKNNNIFLEMTVKMQHMYCVTEDKFTVLDRLFAQVNPKDTIIFCRFIKSMEECRKRYPDCLVLSYQKESFGLNLQDYRNTVYFDKVWDYALRIQSGRRTYRQGQEFDCQYYDLTGNIGLELLIDANIDKKIDMVEYFKGKTKEELEAAL